MSISEQAFIVVLILNTMVAVIYGTLFNAGFGKKVSRNI